MGGVIFVVLVALVIAILITPAIRTRFGQKPPPTDGEPRQETPHEVVIRRLDDHRARRNTPRDDASDKKS